MEYLNFFNTVISELLLVDVKIEKDKTLILPSSLSQSCDYITTTMLYGKEALILEVTLTLLSYEIKKRPNQEE